ncbi:MAG: restriction endonuclease subunit S [Fibrobacteraceae bacterium]|nr:restriction endonuclease subunit S [Fibrobacteraceae bacterium]
MKETKFKQTLVQTKEGSRHCEEHSDVAIQGGFKMTEVGMIPSDWEVLPIKGLCTKVTDGSHESPKEVDNGYYMPSVKDMTDLGFCFSDCKQISKNDYLKLERNGCRPEKDDVLIAKDGSILKYAFVMDDELPIVILSSIAILKPNKKKIDSHYFAHYFKKEDFVNKVLSDYKTGTGVPRIVLNNFKEIEIAYPKKIEEQQRIANALSDIDTLIANLEKLIVKKKNIKQGAMQQLLTGRVRLPGFGLDNGHTDWFTPNGVHGNSIKTAKVVRPEPIRVKDKEHRAMYKMTEVGMIPSDWEVKTLGSLTDKCSYGVGAEARAYCGGVKYIRITDIDDESHRFSPSPITSPSFYQEKHIVQKNDLLVARTGASVGKSYLYDKNDGTLVYAGFLMKLNVFNADSKYVFYNTLTKSYWNWVASESARTGQPGLNLQQMKLYSIPLPSTLKEQQRIANVLSDMDSEISALETKLAKYRTLKTGMMQQLLTGKIRLVDAKPETKSVENNRVVPIAFKRTVLAAEIAHRLCAEPTFGHVKMEKMLFLAEKMCELDINSSYHRDAAGPYDNRALHSVDSQLEKQKWFKFIRSNKGNHYIPLEKRGGHSQYFERYYSECRSVFDSIISTFKTAKTEQCEIVATLYSAWEDFLNQGANPTDDQIVTEVLTNWNESKKRISKERWIKALSWMKENSFVPRRT